MERRLHSRPGTGRRPGKAGFTLIEASIAMVLLASITGTLLYLLDTTSGAFRSGAVSLDLDTSGDAAMDVIADHLRASRSDWLTPPSPDGSYLNPSVDFQEAVGILPGASDPADKGPTERLAFEYAPGEVDDGVDNNGDGLVDEGQVVLTLSPGQPDERRRVLVTDVRETPPGEILGNGIDDDGNGVVDDLGFSIQQVGNHLDVRLTLERVDKDGRTITQTFVRTVRLRN